MEMGGDGRGCGTKFCIARDGFDGSEGKMKLPFPFGDGTNRI